MDFLKHIYEMSSASQSLIQKKLYHRVKNIDTMF